MNFSNHENGENWHFREFFHFYSILHYYKIRTKTNFQNPNGSLDLHLTMCFMLKDLFPDSADSTVAIFKIPKYQNIFRLCCWTWSNNSFSNVAFLGQLNETIDIKTDDIKNIILVLA